MRSSYILIVFTFKIFIFIFILINLENLTFCIMYEWILFAKKSYELLRIIIIYLKLW